MVKPRLIQSTNMLLKIIMYLIEQQVMSLQRWCYNLLRGKKKTHFIHIHIQYNIITTPSKKYIPFETHSE